MVELRVKYDAVADALYIRVRDAPVQESIEVSEGIIVDFDERNEVIGVEILGFSKSKLNLNEIVRKGIEAISVS